ncbi:hypothetical protein L9G16_21610, partial [Shewanella sp. A25]|nr:hypothetical protein [Shewanella shenzhenensis]
MISVASLHTPHRSQHAKHLVIYATANSASIKTSIIDRYTYSEGGHNVPRGYLSLLVIFTAGSAGFRQGR